MCVNTGQNELHFHIKNMGPGTWTDKLYNLGMTHPNITIEGPYGKITMSVDLQTSDNVILCAGGIGITPILSIFLELYVYIERQFSGHLYPSLVLNGTNLSLSKHFNLFFIYSVAWKRRSTNV